jgi:hypothetical protein
MTRLLARAIEEASRLPETLQDEIAERLLADIQGIDERQALTAEGFPVFAVPPDARPITREMVQRALEEG